MKNVFKKSGLFLLLWLCQTAAKQTRTINNKHDPLFQDCVVAEQLQQLPSAFIFCLDALEYVMGQISRIDGSNLYILKVWTAESAWKRRLQSMYFSSKMSVL